MPAGRKVDEKSRCLAGILRQHFHQIALRQFLHHRALKTLRDPQARQRRILDQPVFVKDQTAADVQRPLIAVPTEIPGLQFAAAGKTVAQAMVREQIVRVAGAPQRVR